MNRQWLGWSLIVTVCAFALTGVAQQSGSDAASTLIAATASAVPQLVRYSGILRDASGKALNGITGVTFLLYKEEQGGEPLWLETQNVHPDKTGHYSVVLGSMTSQGLPQDVFASGEARWLGVQVEGQEEQPRVLLVAVPYALKAGDSETVGGLPASAFVLANGAKESVTNASGANTRTAASSAENPSPSSANAAVTGKGTADYIAMWDTTSELIDSLIFQKSSNVGIGTTAPAAKLDVNGKADVRDTLTLFPQATDPTLAITGTAFKIDQTGKVAFVTGQTFPGAGTIEGITTANGSGLIGGGTSGTLSLSLTKTCSAKQVLQWNGSSWACSAAGTGTISGVSTASGSGLQGGGTSGSLNLSLTTSCSSGQTLSWNGSAWACKSLGGTGTVTSVGLTAPSSDFTVTGSPVTASGTLGLNWTVAPTNSSTANAIVKRDSAGGFSAGDISVGNITGGGAATVPGSLAVGGNTYFGGFVGVGVHVAQATLNINEGGAANSDTFLVGNNSTKGVQLRDTGAALDLESIGAPLYINWSTAQPTFIGGNAVGIGTTAPQALLNLNYGGNANADTLLIGNNSSKGMQLRDTGGAVDLESIGVPLYVNNLTQQNLYLNPSNVNTSGSGGVVIGSTNQSSYYPLTVSGGCCTSPPFAAVFWGETEVQSNLYVSGTKNFRIDHPLDPTNKYLDHAAIESSEVLNQYSGNVVLDENGEGRIEFPAWFAAINEDFRYQLTAIGAPGPNLYVAEEVTDNRFTIAGGKPGMKVSWQVTARRNDAYMKAHPYIVEPDKPEWERGYYIHPELFGAPKEQGLQWAHTSAKKER
jgi:hypothetical protein